LGVDREQGDTVFNHLSFEEFRDGLIKDLPDRLQRALQTEVHEGFFECIQRLKRLYVLEVETSTQDTLATINNMKLGVRAYCLYEYTWYELKQLMQQPGVAVTVRLPHHLAMVFAVGEDRSTGKQRHVLVGRPSGGQSPCGWIPFTPKDRIKGVVNWRDHIDLTNGLQAEERYGLTMLESTPLVVGTQSTFIAQRTLYVIEQDPSNFATEHDIEHAHQEVEEWLLEKKIFCSLCCTEATQGDERMRAHRVAHWVFSQHEHNQSDEQQQQAS
jgi:hypothetical protein